MRYYKVDGLSWANRCEPHLSDPELQRILHHDFGLFTIGHYGLIKRRDQLPGDFETMWDSRKTRRPAFWKYVKIGACHFLANFYLKLAMLTAPERPWRILGSNLHSTVWDGDQTLFDLNMCALQRNPQGVFWEAGGERAEFGSLRDLHRHLLPAEYRITYVDQFAPGQYMPTYIFFPHHRDDHQWAIWQQGVDQTPALRKALLKGYRAGHLARRKAFTRRADAVLKRMMNRGPVEDLAA